MIGEHSRKRNIEGYKTVEETTGGSEGVDSGGQAGGDADSADMGTTDYYGEEEGMS
jgi:hypothetical protein